MVVIRTGKAMLIEATALVGRGWAQGAGARDTEGQRVCPDDRDKRGWTVVEALREVAREKARKRGGSNEEQRDEEERLLELLAKEVWEAWQSAKQRRGERPSGWEGSKSAIECLESWNDEEGRTQESVIRVLKEATRRVWW